MVGCVHDQEFGASTRGALSGWSSRAMIIEDAVHSRVPSRMIGGPALVKIVDFEESKGQHPIPYNSITSWWPYEVERTS